MNHKLISPNALSRAFQATRRKAMTDEQDLEPVEVQDAKEALKTGISTGESLLREGIENFGQYKHWASAAFTALEPLPVHQEHFRLKCWEKRGAAEAKLREGIHLLKQSLRAMDDPQFHVNNPTFSYRRLIASLSD
jgi:hypothetical protein